MKLYPKKLRSLEELKREKYELKYAIANTDTPDIFSIGGGGKKKKNKNKKDDAEDGDNSLMAIVSDLLASKGSLDILLTLGKPLLGMAGRKIEKGFLKTIAKEVFGGYIKWKLIEMSYKTTLRFIRSKQHKHKSKS